MTNPAGPSIDGERREELRRRLQALGFEEVRFAAAGAPNASLLTWLDAGNQADMDWMERTAEKRMQADQVLTGVRSVILLGVNYGPGGGLPSRGARPEWARYAQFDDYHDTLKPGLAAAGKVLEEMCGFGAGDYRYYVDTGPVLERGWAARAGLGFRGKNAMLISPRHGNWLFLAAILARREIAPDVPLRPGLRPDADEPAGLLCGKCTRCLDACPTNAFPAPGIVDARRCISYQTIENKGIIPRELRVGIGTRIYGCDICLEVCPWNRFAREGRRMLLRVRTGFTQLDLREILDLTPARFAETFRRTAIKRLKLRGLLRNACVVAGNAGTADLLPALLRLAAHELPVVRAHAVWAVRRLAGDRAGGLLAPIQAVEKDEAVLAEFAGG